MEQLGSHWTDFLEIWYLSNFLESVEKIQVSLTSYKNNGYFTWSPTYIFYHVSPIFLRMRNISDKSCIENQNTHFVINNFFFENTTLSEIMWKNIAEPGWPQMTIWCMRIACWMPKAKNTHWQYVILIDFPLQHWLQERASILTVYLHCPSCPIWKGHCSLYVHITTRRVQSY